MRTWTDIPGAGNDVIATTMRTWRHDCRNHAVGPRAGTEAGGTGV